MPVRKPQGPWNRLLENLPTYLDELLGSPIYGRTIDRDPPPKSHGVYLFTEKGKHLYVGRCGITERARRKGEGHSNFRTRLADHTRPSSGHNQATFAWRLTLNALDKKIDQLPRTRAERQVDKKFEVEFLRQKERVTQMDFRIVAILDDFESYVFEPYAAAMLETPYNSWATS
jgi:hypothetical protein